MIFTVFFVLLFAFVEVPCPTDAMTLDALLEVQRIQDTAKLRGGCWKRVLEEVRESCPTIDSGRQAELALKSVNCQLSDMKLPQIHCDKLDDCAAFKEIADHPTLLQVYVRFYVQVATTCAFQQLHKEATIMTEVAEQIVKAVETMAADLGEVINTSKQAQQSELRIGVLQNETLTKLSVIRTLVESDQVIRIYDTIQEIRLFLSNTYYSLQLSIEALLLIVFCLIITRPSAMRHCWPHLVGLCVFKLSVDRQIVYILLRHNSSIENSLPGLLVVSRTLFLVGVTLVIMKTKAPLVRKIVVGDIENSLNELELEMNLVDNNPL